MEDTSIRATALDMAIKVMAGSGQIPTAANVIKFADKVYAFLCEEATEEVLDAEFRRGYDVGYEEGYDAGDEAGYQAGGVATSEESPADCFRRGFEKGEEFALSNNLAEVIDLDAHRVAGHAPNYAWGYQHPNHPSNGRV